MKVEPTFNLCIELALGDGIGDHRHGASECEAKRRRSAVEKVAAARQRGERRQGAAHARAASGRCARSSTRRSTSSASEDFPKLDRRDHQPRQGRARHLLHLFRQQGGGVPGAGPRHVGAGARPCRAGVRRRDRRRSTRERRALAAFLRFVAEHKQVYRIIDEAEFVDPEGFRNHYETTAARIAARLADAAARGELRDDESPLALEVVAWALMGVNVFLGLRFAVWGNSDPDEVAAITNRLLRHGLGVR